MKTLLILGIYPPEWIIGPPKKLIAWFNTANSAFHALPGYTNAVHNAMLRSLVGVEESSSYGISTFSHPLTLFTGQIDAQTLQVFSLSIRNQLTYFVLLCEKS